MENFTRRGSWYEDNNDAQVMGTLWPILKQEFTKITGKTKRVHFLLRCALTESVVGEYRDPLVW